MRLVKITDNAQLNYLSADPSGRSIWGVDLRPLACWDYGFESCRRHGCLSLVSVVCCQVEVSATSWSLVQRSPTECGVTKKCDREASKNGRPWPPGAVESLKKKRTLVTVWRCYGLQVWHPQNVCLPLRGRCLMLSVPHRNNPTTSLSGI
jgi:hypothetical protein